MTAWISSSIVDPPVGVGVGGAALGRGCVAEADADGADELVDAHRAVAVAVAAARREDEELAAGAGVAALKKTRPSAGVNGPGFGRLGPGAMSAARRVAGRRGLPHLAAGRRLAGLEDDAVAVAGEEGGRRALVARVDVAHQRGADGGPVAAPQLEAARAVVGGKEQRRVEIGEGEEEGRGAEGAARSG